MLRKNLICLIASLAVLLLSMQPSSASQASCIMPTTGTVSGLTLVNDINACTASLLSNYSGASAPPTPTTGMYWLNTSTNYVQQYDGAVWNNLWYVDPANHLTTPILGGGVTSTSMLAASTVDLGSVPQFFINITGSTTINSFGTSASQGTIKVILFNGAPLIVSGATMVPPGFTNRQTQAGDIAVVVRIGTGWLFTGYQLARQPAVGAYSLLGNSSGSLADPVDIFGPSLPQKVTPSGADKILLWDSAASNALKYATASSMAALAGVTSIDGVAGTFTTGNGINSSGSVIGITAARRTLPTTTVLTTGTDLTYTTPANALWLELKFVGGGAGGGGGNNASLSTAGGSTCWNTSGTACTGPAFLASGGAGSSTTVVGAGGAASGAGFSNTAGSSGSPGGSSSAASNGPGGSGGHSCLGGGAAGNGAGAGASAAANTGAGGGGGSSSNGSISGQGGSGGASGGCASAIINSPAATYTYTIGAGGAHANGANVSSSVGSNGGDGGSGRIEIVVHYGS